MLKSYIILLFAPLNVLTYPLSVSFSATQLVFQSAGSPVIEPKVAAASSSAVQLVYQFPDEVTLENLAARSNGHLLLTASNGPNVYEYNPKSKEEPKIVCSFTGVSSTLGIVETAPDVFAVVAGNWSNVTLHATPGTFSLMSIDFNNKTKNDQPSVKNITHVPTAMAWNGATNLQSSPNIVLIADSVLGAVWKVDVITGNYSVAIQHPDFEGISGAMGINGICTFEGKLYFLNSAQGTYGRITIDIDGSALGEVETLKKVVAPQSLYDDFAMDWEGNAWVATHQHELDEITITGKQRTILTNDPNVIMEQPTSVIFGRGSKEKEHTLYMTTAGERGITGGQVFSIKPWLL
ncbi:hypothetical protein MMC17_002410 [Xylographa soralifera]|nr:hypothetical protein [Xylographa soralifera]